MGRHAKHKGQLTGEAGGESGGSHTTTRPPGPEARKACVAGTAIQPRGAIPGTAKGRRRAQKSAITSAVMRSTLNTFAGTGLVEPLAAQLKGSSTSKAGHIPHRLQDTVNRTNQQPDVVKHERHTKHLMQMVTRVRRNRAVPELMQTASLGHAGTTRTQWRTPGVPIQL